MLTLLLPLESRFVTTFQLAAILGLVDTPAGLVLPALVLGTPFFRDFVLPLCWRRAAAVFVVAFKIGWHR